MPDKNVSTAAPLLLPVLFALATALFWGLYGPALGNARSSARPPEWSPFKPYLFIGVAYLVWGVVGGFVAMKTIPATPDTLDFTGKYLPAMKWGFLAGSLGAFGALTLTYAVVESKGNTALVMPIVFGGAVTVTALTNLVVLRGHVQINPMLWVGMLCVAGGIVLVTKYTPHGHAPKPAAGGPAAVHAPAVPGDATSTPAGTAEPK